MYKNLHLLSCLADLNWAYVWGRAYIMSILKNPGRALFSEKHGTHSSAYECCFMPHSALDAILLASEGPLSLTSSVFRLKHSRHQQKLSHPAP